MKENILSKSKTWIYPRFVQMILDHAYPNLEKDENNDLLVLYHMDNETLKVLARYHKNHPESSTKTEFFGFIKDKNYVDPDPVDHLKWRNEEEKKEASYVEELKILANFKETRNEWFLKEEKKKRSRKTTPKAAGEEGGNEEESSSSSSEEEIDETERAKRIQAEIEKEKHLKIKRREEKDDDVYVPSPEHVIESQTPPSFGGRKKASARKRVVSPKAARRKLIVKLPKRTSKPKPTTPPKQPTPSPSPPPQSDPIPSPLHLSLPHLSPLHLSPPHQTPIQEQPVITSQHIFQTPPSTQPQVQTTPGSSGLKDFPQIPGNIPLDDIGDFGFANDEQVKKLEMKMEEVLVENKKLVDREKKLEKHVKTVETENSSLLKKVEADQV
ncbi:hypothetical protein Hdeb2414_s0001g00014511 [Helianthus debilis subsp. tardiflorus]